MRDTFVEQESYDGERDGGERGGGDLSEKLTRQ